MSALAVTRGPAWSDGARAERPEIARERAPFQRHLQTERRLDEERDAPRAAPKKIQTKSAKKLESTAPAPDRTPAPQAPEEPTLASGTGPVEVVAATSAAVTAVTTPTPAVGPTPAPANANATPGITPMAPELANLPLSPLEQALQDLVDRMQPVESEHEDPEELGPPMATIEIVPTHAPFAADSEAPAVRPAHHVDAPTPVTDLERLAELQATQAENASHVNLVIDDGDARIVLAVAVHGQDVRVAMRAGDDHLAASLARNAASLDHALHARGLDLAELANESSPQRDPAEGRSSQQQKRERDERPASHFRIEEYV